MTEETNMTEEATEAVPEQAKAEAEPAEQDSTPDAAPEGAAKKAKGAAADEDATLMKWYVVTTYSGYENKVKLALQERIRQHHMEEKFGEILVPSENVTTHAKDGKARVRSKTTFPGYVFVEMHMGETQWHVVKDTPKVTGFIGNQKPREVKPPQLEELRRGITEGAAIPKAKQQFQEGDEVRVTVGAFANFSGAVQEVKPDKRKLKVMVSIFGRPTPVELDFNHVEKTMRG